jgi:hypothetical protein
MDFTTPPPAAKLEQVRQRVQSTLPKVELEKSTPPVAIVEKPAPPPPAPPKPKPIVDLGDFKAAPSLSEYTKNSVDGSDSAIELATQLEAKGEFKRALLAWERVIDLTKPDDRQAGVAIASIQRLRPTLPLWNEKPKLARPITLHASAGKKMAKSLLPILEEVARDLERASSGIIKVKVKVSAGRTNAPAQQATPVAIWLTGADSRSSSTTVRSFTVDSADALRPAILKNVFRITRSHLSRWTTFTAPADLNDAENPLDALSYRLTRLCWSEFAAALNPPPKKK